MVRIERHYSNERAVYAQDNKIKVNVGHTRLVNYSGVLPEPSLFNIRTNAIGSSEKS